jgi:DNA-directed RNA polymerase subunit RPC12/RpoP
VSSNKIKEEVPNNCPHCGRELSPWEKVLLSVDRALMCKNCLYRIILGVKIKNSDEKNSEIKNYKQD